MTLTPALLAAILAACSSHPTPPPQRYIDAALATLPHLPVQITEAADAKAACAAVGIPRAGACGWVTTRYNIIVPTGNLGAVCHELGHLGGWPANHRR